MRTAIHQIFAALRRRSRKRRYLQVQKLTAVESSSGFVLDLGGGPASFFASLFPRPRQVLLLDLALDKIRLTKQKHPAISVIAADGERLPLADGSSDTIICNSVLEYVENPKAVANEIRRVGRTCSVQTPNGRFPLETHSFIAIPFYNLVPWPKLRQGLCRIFGAPPHYLSSVRYLSEGELKSLFPEATITYERAFGLKKSFYLSFCSDDPP